MAATSVNKVTKKKKIAVQPEFCRFCIQSIKKYFFTNYIQQLQNQVTLYHRFRQNNHYIKTQPIY